MTDEELAEQSKYKMLNKLIQSTEGSKGMIDEELKKEAIKFAVGYPTSYGKGYKHKDLRIAYLAGAEPRDNYIEKLEKENSELKKRNGELAGQKASLERWFGEAKKIIQSFVWWHTGEDRGSIDSNNLVERAEQFLKEVNE